MGLVAVFRYQPACGVRRRRGWVGPHDSPRGVVAFHHHYCVSSSETEGPRLGYRPRIIRIRIGIDHPTGTRAIANDEGLTNGNHLTVEVQERIVSGSSDFLQVTASAQDS